MMADLLELRVKLRKFFSVNERVIIPVFRASVALGCFFYVNMVVGYNNSISSLLILLLALVCAFLPWGCITIFTGALILLHLSQVSLEVFLTTAAIFVLMFLIYLIFLPRYNVLIAVLPLLFFLKVPFIAPLMFGLIGGFSTIIPIIFGVVWYYFLEYINFSAAILTDTSNLTFVQRYVQLLNGLKNNEVMFWVLIAFVISFLLVAVIKQAKVDYPRILAAAAGTIANIIIILSGLMVSPAGNATFSLSVLLMGSAVSVLVVLAVDFMILALDFKRTENIQFEDDEYYYYVTAVPKIAVAESEVQVKKISSHNKHHGRNGGDKSSKGKR